MNGRIGRQAKIVSSRELRRLLALAGRSKHAERNCVMVLLGVLGGLRAQEIAGLTWSMVLDANGQIGSSVEVRRSIAKWGSGRRIPMHPKLRQALVALRAQTLLVDRAPHCAVVLSAKSGAMLPNSVVNWFSAVFRQAGLQGCSSHSLRRTFVTNAARTAHRAGASLRDVQMLAGHRSIETTQCYIEGDTDAQRRLVRGL